MAGIIYDLVDVLEAQKECYEGLIILATYKTEAVAQKKLEVLSQVVEREEAFIGRVQLLDKQREALLKDIAIVTGINYSHLTIHQLIDKMGKDLEVSQKLTSIRQELLKLLETLHRQNEINKQVLNQSLEFTEFAINAIKTTKLTEAHANYVKPGTEQEERAVSFYDQMQ